MPLQTHGSISISNVAYEFFNVSNQGMYPPQALPMSRFYKDLGLDERDGVHKSQPFDTSVNAKIPFAGNPISLSDFYGSAWYQGYFIFTGYGESYDRYYRSNDAFISWSLTHCTSPLILLTIDGSVTKVTGGFTDTRSGTHWIGNLDYNKDFNVSYTDCRGTWSGRVSVNLWRSGTSFARSTRRVKPDVNVVGSRT